MSGYVPLNRKSWGCGTGQGLKRKEQRVTAIVSEILLSKLILAVLNLYSSIAPTSLLIPLIPPLATR